MRDHRGHTIKEAFVGSTSLGLLCSCGTAMVDNRPNQASARRQDRPGTGNQRQRFSGQEGSGRA